MTVEELIDILGFVQKDLDIVTEEGKGFIGVLITTDKRGHYTAMMEVE